MKKASLIVNRHSGLKKASDFNKERILAIFKEYDYEVSYYETKYPNHAGEIVKSLPDDTNLVLSVGGDGTFNELVTGNLKRKKPLVLSHVPHGTTNDIGAMFSLGKNLEKNIYSILSGEIKKIDICTLNNHPFVYVAGFGKFMNVPYETPRKLKKRIGYIAYLFEGVKDFFQTKTPLYDVTVEVNGETIRGLYSFALISNANRIAGIKNFYKNVQLDDKQFEVLLCNLRTKKEIVKSLFGLKMSDVTKIPGFYFYKANTIKFTFHEHLRKPWCIDGEEYTQKGNTYTIKVIPDLEMMLPRNIQKELFVHEP